MANFGKTFTMNRQVNIIGFWAGMIATIATVAYCIVQVLQLYDLLPYPLDERLIYGTSLFIVIPFVLAMLAFHHIAPVQKRFWSHAALLFAVLYAVFVTANYIVQLATVIPMTLNDRLDEVRVLQQTPHSMFWNFDAAGYIFMGFSALMAAAVPEGRGFQKTLRWALIAHAAVTPLISVVYFYPDYSYNVLLLGLPWVITAPAFMLLLAINFKKNLSTSKKPATASDLHLSENQPVREESIGHFS